MNIKILYFICDRNKALELLKNDGKVEVFLQNYNGIYKYIYKI